MKTQPRRLAHGELAGALPPGGHTILSSCSAESDLLAAEVEGAGGALGNMCFSAILVPGLNKHVWRAGTDSTITTFFQTPELRKEGARSTFLPLCYQDVGAWYEHNPPDAALFMCSPPDANGNCSFGTEVAFVADNWRKTGTRIAHINPLMPATPGDTGIPFSELTAYFEAEQPLRTMAVGGTDPVTQAIARHAAQFIGDGATLQTGVGKLPDAVLDQVSDRRNLRLNTGLICDGALRLVNSGAMADGQSAIVGCAIGQPELYAGLTHPHFEFRPVSVTHDVMRLAAIPQLITINSVMSVDLFGQGFAEASARGFMSGPGGASDFARAARLSPGGLRIIILPSAAGDISRIVAPGEGIGPASLGRMDIDIVVTEHGAADLRGKSHQERAKLLIAIADPAHREALERAWSEVAAII
jgi:acyl-CoA hydrolase